MVPNEIEIIKLERIVLETIAVAAKDPRAIRVRLTTALRCMVLLVMVLPIADRHSVVHLDMNRARAAPILAAPVRTLVVDVRTKAIRVTTIPLDAPQVANARCTAAQKIIAVQNNMPRATILAAVAAPALVPVHVPALSAAADPLLPPGVSAALVGEVSALVASAPADLARQALVAEVSVLQHLAAVDLAEASDSVDLEAASAARLQR